MPTWLLVRVRIVIRLACTTKAMVTAIHVRWDVLRISSVPRPDIIRIQWLPTIHFILLHLVYMPEAALLSDGMYIENLHTQDVACNTGLRAPPVC